MKKFFSSIILLLIVFSYIPIVVHADTVCPNDVYDAARKVIDTKKLFKSTENADYFLPRYKKLDIRSLAEVGDPHLQIELNASNDRGWQIAEFGKYDPVAGQTPPLLRTYPSAYATLPNYFPLTEEEMDTMHRVWMAEPQAMDPVRGSMLPFVLLENECKVNVPLESPIPDNIPLNSDGTLHLPEVGDNIPGGKATTGYGTVNNIAQSDFTVRLNPEDIVVEYKTGSTTGTTVKNDTLVISGFVIAKKAMNLSLKLAYGKDENNLDSLTDFIVNRPINANDQVNFTGRAKPVDTDQTYYFRVVDGKDPKIAYSYPVPYVKVKVNTFTDIKNGSTSVDSNLPTMKNGLVVCSGYQDEIVTDAEGKDIQINKDCGFPEIMETIRNIMNFAFFLILPIAAIVFAYTGWLFLSSGGSPETASQAREILTKAVIGLVVILAAWLIVNTIYETLGAKSCYNWLAQQKGGDNIPTSCL